MNEFYENLKREASANPIMTMAIAASLLAGASKFVEALGHYKGSAAFAKDAERRFRASKR